MNLSNMRLCEMDASSQYSVKSEKRKKLVRVYDNILQTLQYLKSLDDELVMAVSVYYEEFGKKRLYKSLLCSENEREELDKLVMNTGSTSEGSAICRLFNDSDDAHLEIDQMVIFWTFPREVGQQVGQQVEGRAGFYNILLDDHKDMIFEHRVKCKKLRRIFEEELEHGKYLQAGNIKIMVDREEREIQEELAKNGTNSLLQLKFASYMKYLHCKRLRVEYDSSFEGPSLQLTFKFYDEQTDQMYFRLSLDRVAAAYLTFWPAEADEWIHRSRQWPPKEIVDIITSGGCHLVCKEDVAWRMSFSKAEMTLTRNRTESMKLCHLVFKLIFYRHIRIVEIDDTQITSYVAKTIMMWEQEKHPPNYWEESTLEEILRDLFSKLHHGLAEGTIPGYFLPKLNVLDGKPESLLNETSIIAKEIAENPMAKVEKFVQSLDRKYMGDKMTILRDLAKVSDKNSCLSRILCCFKCLRCQCRDQE